MQPHQQRVADEKSELDAKLNALMNFVRPSIAGDTLYDGLPRAEKARLSRQAAVMKEYSEILAERIAAFPEATA